MHKMRKNMLKGIDLLIKQLICGVNIQIDKKITDLSLISSNCQKINEMKPKIMQNAKKVLTC